MIAREINNQNRKFRDKDEDNYTLCVTLGDLPGEVDLCWDAVEEAKSYVVQSCRYTFSGKASLKWKHVDIVTESLCAVTGLKKGLTYGFRIAVISSSTQGCWSKPVYKKIE